MNAPPAVPRAPGRCHARSGATRPGYTLIASLLTALTLALCVVAFDLVVRGTLARPAGERQSTRLAGAATQGLAWALDRWPRAARVLASGDSVVLAAPGGADFVVTVTVVNRGGGDYRLRADAVSLAGGEATARVRRSLLATRRTLRAFDPPVVAAGRVYLRNLQEVDGRDWAPPSGADCAAPGPDGPGVLVTDRASLVEDSATFLGSAPAPIQTLPALAAGAAARYGDLTVDDLVAIANVRLPAGAVVNAGTVAGGAGVDATGAATCSSWGNPDLADGCQSYYPIIYAAGAVTLDGVVGQGILVADGPVTLTGATRFWGLVIARTGNVWFTGGGTPTVYGQVAQLQPTAALTLDAGAVRRSSCALSRLTRALGLARPVVVTPIAVLLRGASPW